MDLLSLPDDVLVIIFTQFPRALVCRRIFAAVDGVTLRRPFHVSHPVAGDAFVPDLSHVPINSGHTTVAYGGVVVMNIIRMWRRITIDRPQLYNYQLEFMADDTPPADPPTNLYRFIAAGYDFNIKYNGHTLATLRHAADVRILRAMCVEVMYPTTRWISVESLFEFLSAGVFSGTMPHFHLVNSH